MPDFLAEARSIEADVTALRHDLHRHPEIGNDLPQTQARVLTALEGLPLEVTPGTRSTSVIAVLRGGAAPADVADRPVVLLRGDMDALPVPEETGMPFASETPGRMHACGHDIHTATLAGAARLLAAHRQQLPGDVVFMFQPGEEMLNGAPLMIEDGVLDAAGKRADRAYGLHVLSAYLPHGIFATKPGTIMAGSDRLDVDIIGQGGHGSTPALANDPVPVMAEIILALQTMVTRKFSAFDPVVVNVGVANAGGAANVIPEKCHIECSIRTFSAAHRTKVERVTREIVEGICAAHGMRAEIAYVRGVGPTVNDPAAAQFAGRQIEAVLGPERSLTMTEPLAGSEDFSHVLNAVPGAFVFYSGVPAGRDLADATFNHSATAWFDDCVMADATALYAQLGYAALQELALAGD